MKEFKDLGVKTVAKRFSGEKIKMNRVLNQKIIVYDYKVTPSKFEGNGSCLHLQIEIQNEKRLLFTRGTALIESLDQMNKITDFPFMATIVRNDDNGPFEFR